MTAAVRSGCVAANKAAIEARLIDAFGGIIDSAGSV